MDTRCILPRRLVPTFRLCQHCQVTVSRGKKLFCSQFHMNLKADRAIFTLLLKICLDHCLHDKIECLIYLLARGPPPFFFLKLDHANLAFCMTRSHRKKNLFYRCMFCQDIRTADWSENVAPFWPAVIKLSLSWKGLSSALKCGKYMHLTLLIFVIGIFTY